MQNNNITNKFMKPITNNMLMLWSIWHEFHLSRLYFSIHQMAIKKIWNNLVSIEIKVKQFKYNDDFEMNVKRRESII